MILAPLSLDLDDKWSYLKTRGAREWTAYPTYLPVVIPRALAFLARRGIRCTWFLVGQDAALARNRELLRAVAPAGHEIANHSFAHESWLHLYSAAQVADDVARAEESIEAATGVRPRGFRGPGYSVTPVLIRDLMRRGYVYDASTFPNLLAPLVRFLYLGGAQLEPAEIAKRKRLGGRLRDVLQPIAPYQWGDGQRRLIEVPVTTVPAVRTPFHMSYLLGLAVRAPGLARQYFRAALRVCRIAGVPPSFVLHPLDFLGDDDAPDLSFLYGMQLHSTAKQKFLEESFDVLQTYWRLTTMEGYVAALPADSLPVRRLMDARE